MQLNGTKRNLSNNKHITVERAALVECHNGRIELKIVKFLRYSNFTILPVAICVKSTTV